MKRLHERINKGKKILSIYFTAGFPALEDTVPVLLELEKQGVDMIEIGLPFSDPLADGPVIQESSTRALQNGMSTEILFQQLSGIREHIKIPLVIMGYFNPVLQYGVARFCKKCAEIGIDGLILPDLPLDVYLESYADIFKSNGLGISFLITPQTSEERIREIDDVTTGFIYMVSTASTTGRTAGFDEGVQEYFSRIARMGLQNPLVVGFGIHDKETFKQATAHADGAIIGSAFIRELAENGRAGIGDFIKRFR